MKSWPKIQKNDAIILDTFRVVGFTHRPLSSSFLGLPYRILSINHKKELLRGLWVNQLSRNGNPLLVSALLSARADANDRITKAVFCFCCGFGFRVLGFRVLEAVIAFVVAWGLEFGVRVNVGA